MDEITSSNLFFNTSSLIASNIFAVSPNVSVPSIFFDKENNINCKYFHIMFLVFSLIFSFQISLNSMFSKNFVFLVLSVNNSSFSYNISKNLSG